MRGRGSHPPRSGRGGRFFFASAALAALAWFATPVPEMIASAVVDAIPLDEDVALGCGGVRQAQYRPVTPCRPGRRCVDDVGRSVVDAVLRNHPQLASTIAHYDWQFAVTDQSFVNAFAYPGGRIFVTRGLLDVCTDDELAAVIGHEVGHVLHRHSQKRLVQQRLGRVLLSALLLGDADGRSESFGEEAAGTLLQYASELSTLQYSRSNEYEADEIGWYACTSLGRAGDGCRAGALQSFLRKLDGGVGATEWHSTHPGTASRIDTLDALQARYERTRRGSSSTSAARSSVSMHDTEAFVDAFAPSALRWGGSASTLASIGGAFVSMIPAEAQRALLVGALWQGAALLEQAWEVIVAAADSSGPPPPSAPRRRRSPQQKF